MAVQLSLFEAVPMTTKFPSTRYQGSKQKYVNWIWECVKDIPFHTVLDAFGGTGSVAYRMKQEGKEVTYNDLLPFNYLIGKALIENGNVKLEEREIEELLRCHANISYPDFIESTFKDIYFTDEENHWLDIVLTNIRWMTDPYKQAIAYFALFQSCIIKRPYNLFHRRNLYVRLQDVERSFGNKKTWDTPFEVHFRKFVREANNAVFDNGTCCRAMNNDVFNILPHHDLVYIDTPYLNDAGVGVDYADFYHFLNGIVNYDRWDSLIDYNSKHLRLRRQFNEWNDASLIRNAFVRLFTLFQDSVMVISYRSNGIPAIEELVGILRELNKEVRIHRGVEMKYALSKRQSSEVLIIAR
ncbi:DNA adenine methylase [Butyricimonas virosa]|jgi:adenine-specific DNA-methyltransferase|uniref:DNA adenine methylase n=1 Tax=Butyricimonas virosa TaxID=544645 RepID=UPI000EEC85F5|nr:DNA adenine methylase [Butyricimonas virosa]MCI7294226.1 DNA adenine methylase [Butyricimonas virosa]MDY5490513.1 DNA adenine methylase [Butyricimonas virosa]MDY5532554.1 DNA adenine methylase [Butyricimonas virosa]MDY6218691.1 DNA adenine methylase [Butyricimonas virosa]HAH72727.1 DNA methyltransferase [Butyricimonas virosa]